MIEDTIDNNSSPEDDDMTPDRYINYQAFLANLMAAGLWLPSPSQAMMAMHGAFQRDGGSEHHTIREAWILGAVQWIFWSGQELYKLLLWQTDIQMNEGGRFTRNSWRDWKAGFQNISGNESYGDKCRLITGHTAELMQAIETAYNWVI